MVAFMETDDPMETRRKGTKTLRTLPGLFYPHFVRFIYLIILGLNFWHVRSKTEISGDQTVSKTIKNLLNINELSLVVTQ